MVNTFGIPLIPDNEEERLGKLRSLTTFNSYQEEGPLKHIAALASRMFKVPIALVNLVDSEYVWTSASAGLDNPPLVPRGTSLCSLAILKDELTVFENAQREPCLLTNPMVAGDFGLRFYAAAPLKTSDGHNIGALCIVDKEPREFSAGEQKILENLASIAVEELEKGLL